MAYFDLGAPVDVDIHQIYDVETYANWVEKTRDGVAPECGALAMDNAVESDLITDSYGEGCI